MRRFLTLIRRLTLLPLALLLMVLALAALVYWAAQVGSVVPVETISVRLTPLPSAAVPLEPFAGIDPAIIPYLEQPGTPLAVIGDGIPPVGAYLPREGTQRFELPTATLAPSPTPRPTLTITPTPSATLTPTPTVIGTFTPTPTSELVATVLAFAAQITPAALPFAGAECAPSGLPTDGRLTQRFHGVHSGIDLSAPLNTPMFATHSGTITWADWNPFGYGNLVIIQSGRFITYYAHLTAPNVVKGDVIGKGSIIGWSGSTGNSSGPHLHYETRIDDVPVDPLTFAERGFVAC